MRRRRGFGRGGVVARGGVRGRAGRRRRLVAVLRAVLGARNGFYVEKRRARAFLCADAVCRGGCGRVGVVVLSRSCVLFSREKRFPRRETAYEGVSLRGCRFSGVAAGWASSSCRGPACGSRARNAFRVEKRRVGAFLCADAVCRGGCGRVGVVVSSRSCVLFSREKRFPRRETVCERVSLCGCRFSRSDPVARAPGRAKLALRGNALPAHGGRSRGHRLRGDARDDRSACDVRFSRRAGSRCGHRLISTSLATVFALRAVPVTPSRFSNHPACSFEPPIPSG